MWLVKEYRDDSHSPTLGDPIGTYTVPDEERALMLIIALFLESYWDSPNNAVKQAATTVVLMAKQKKHQLAIDVIEALVHSCTISSSWVYLDASGTDEDAEKRLKGVLDLIAEQEE